jgi:hypothetical protein
MSAPAPDREIKARSSLHGERVWRRVGERPHRTRDNREVLLVVWETPCLICGEPFEILSTMKVDQSHFRKIVTCPAHRMTRRESLAMRGATNRRATFEMIRRDKLNRSPGRANG